MSKVIQKVFPVVLAASLLLPLGWSAPYMAVHQPDTTDANISSAVYGMPAVDGTVDAIWNNAPELQVNRYQLAWQGATGVAKTLWDDQNLYVLIQVTDAQLDKSSPNAVHWTQQAKQPQAAETWMHMQMQRKLQTMPKTA